MRFEVFQRAGEVDGDTFAITRGAQISSDSDHANDDAVPGASLMNAWERVSVSDFTVEAMLQAGELRGNVIG